MPTYRVDVLPTAPGPDHHLEHEAKLLGLTGVGEIRRSRYYLLSGETLSAAEATKLGAKLLADPIIEIHAALASGQSSPAPEKRRVLEVQRRTGVMDPAEASIVKGAADLGIALNLVRVGTRVEITNATDAQLETLAWKCLANKAVEEVAIDPRDAVRLRAPGGNDAHKRTEVPLRTLDNAALEKLSRDGQLSLTLEEMQTIQAHFKTLGREPTNAELESLAQTWSEHCVHKTLKGLVKYTGPTGENGPIQTVVIDNLLKSTIAKATKELNRPWCLSVFVDNSGVIEFDDEFGVCIKVETHNRPSAIEPYGGANTGLGGVVRDIIGTGIGARPVFSTDVFCFGDPATPAEDLPPGTIHPRRLMRAVVAGVRDYGNRMGIPTVNGAVRFDQRYLGNPLVFCGTGGLIPRSAVNKAANVGDHLVVIGGATGRDGIHGATFSSAGLTQESEVVSSGAVQIGNAIEEKKCLDTILHVRDAGCFSALTDCGAGGLSSVCGEISAEHGCVIELDKVPLKYAGLSYAEIWISESQERMVATIPPHLLDKALALFAAEGVPAHAIGTITGDHHLVLKHHGEIVADLDMHFLHNGVPRTERPAVFTPEASLEVSPKFATPKDLAATLAAVLARPNVASKEWIIRQYDHEVQGGSIVKPLVGIMHDGPSDAAVVAPRLGSNRAVAIACGFNTNFSDVDAWHATAAGMEEALRNLACVGAPLDKVAVLDNFSWAKCTNPEVFGALVRACQACYELALYYGTPFVSGKDSLSNEFSWAGKTIRIPHTLLITALTVMPDAARAITMDVKKAGDLVVMIGETRDELGGSEYYAHLGVAGGRVPRLDRKLSKPVLDGVAALTAEHLVTAAHDCSDGGLATTLAEMAFAGGLGMRIDAAKIPRAPGFDRLDGVLFSESLSRIVVTVAPGNLAKVQGLLQGLPFAVIGEVRQEAELVVSGLGGGFSAPNEGLKRAWKGGLAGVGG